MIGGLPVCVECGASAGGVANGEGVGV